MSDSALSLCFIWHMHQPYYKDPLSGLYRLPWVRLHGTKDYLDMLEILRGFPAVRQNFNLVPSLLEQLHDYTANGASDVYLERSRRPAADLDETDRVFILENFFLAHWDNMIRPFPRYYELLVKRGPHLIRSDLVRAVKYFTDADFRDLQVFFNLCWIDPLFRDRDPFLRGLVEKGQQFTEEEKNRLLDTQLEILRRIIPAYREFSASGQVELSFSPFYHPILPLLCDTDISRVAMPQVRLPRQRFRHPEDADNQIRMGIEYFEQTFGFRPVGMWPSEGSVSEEVLRKAAAQGIQWVATDEGVLSASLRRGLRDGAGNPTDPQALYRPYTYEGVSIVFRDHTLSDLIGFVYSQWDAQRAADDLVNRLLQVRRDLPHGSRALVPIILDGENAWEHYKNDGRDFFLRLYERLSNEERIRTVTVSEYLNTVSRGEPLGYLHPGSWINANYGIWIGHEEDNLSWDYLTETRQSLESFQQANPEADLSNAWKSLYIAEGSDWNWWYGDEHSTETQEDFDELFRLNLMQVYKEMDRDVPAQLFVPILREDRGIAPSLLIRGFIRPKIDGVVTSYYEWYQGAEIDVKKSGGSMHKSESLITTIYYGFNQTHLFLRLDPKLPFAEFGGQTFLSVMTSKPADIRITVPVATGRLKADLFEKIGDLWEKKSEIDDVAIQDIFEIAVPFSALKATEKDEIHLFVSIRKEHEEVERCPWRGHISVTVPTPDFEAMMWY
ncbi:MAG: glycoside hydrolase family 57 protein [Thermodesulfovibrionales bacterium]